MSFWMALINAPGGGTAFVISNGSEPPIVGETGNNQLDNSKLEDTGDGSAARDWTVQLEGTGASAVFASGEATGHRDVTLTTGSAGTQKARIRQTIAGVVGEKYFASAWMKHDGVNVPSGEAVVINTIPWTIQTPITTRPSVEDLATDLTRVSWAFEITEAGDFDIIFGTDKPDAVVTVERVMLDRIPDGEAVEVRGYLATDPTPIVAPVAENDTANTEFETATTISVLANDAAGEGNVDVTTVAVVTNGANGSAVANANGTITYTPNAAFSGQDSFTYTVDNTSGATSNAATVTVTVAADGEEPPVIEQNEAFGTISAPITTDIAWGGRYVGDCIPVVQNAANRLKGGGYGWRVVAPYTGDLQHVQVNVTSNKTNETSKSRVNGSNSHGFPASWDLGFKVQEADSNWQPTGSVLREINFTHSRSAANDGRSRQLHQLDMSSLSVTAGQRLLMWLYSREADPENNHPAYNQHGGQINSVGLTPPKHRSLLEGDTPAFVRGNADGTNMSPVYSDGNNPGFIGNIGIRYITNNLEWGDTGFDGGTTTNVFRFEVLDDLQVRQKLQSPWWFRAKELWLAAYRFNGSGTLSVEITGSDISTINLSLTSELIDAPVASVSNPYDMVRVTLPSPFVGSANTVYTVRLSASGGPVQIHGRRRWAESTTPSSGVVPVAVNQPPDDGEWSDDGGSSWQLIGWSQNGKAFFPIGFFTDGEMATTQGGLP